MINAPSHAIPTPLFDAPRHARIEALPAGRLVLALALTLAACGGPTDVPIGGVCPADELPCGDACCAAGETCDATSSTCVAECQPECAGRACGPDGCGGSCGACAGGEQCEAGKCAGCTPRCDGRTCGDDGCGGSCGVCEGGKRCEDGACVGCVPSCDGRSCGDDGCGGACGTCDDGLRCTASGACVECLADPDCAGASGGEKCAGDGRCVACREDLDCAADGSISCDTTSGRCLYECQDDGDCTSAAAPRCDATSWTCVACLGAQDCGGAPCLGSGGTRACAECGDDSHCAANADLRHCESGSNLCVRCTSDTHCTGAAEGNRCDTVRHACAQCTSNAHCPGGSCQSGRCVSNAVGGDTCASPGVIDLSGGSVTVQGDLSAASHDRSGACGGTGRDLVYAFTLTDRRDVTVEVSSAVTGMQPVLYVSSSCAAGQGERGCAGPGSALTLQDLGPGTWYLWVDSTLGTPQGAFTLTLTALQPPPPVPGDTCANPIPLGFNAAGNATVSGTTTGARGELTSVLCASDGADLVYSFTTAHPGRVTATVAPLQSGFQPTLYLVSTCPRAASSDEKLCQAATAAGGPATLDLASLPAGNYFLVVDGAGSGEGAFDLQVSVPTAPPPNGGERCSDAVALQFTGDRAVTSGSTLGKRDDDVGVCAYFGAPDVVYSFHNPVMQNVQVNVRPRTANFRPSVHLQTACGTSTNACARATGTSSNLVRVFENVPAGTIYLWVDGALDHSAGEFDLVVTRGVTIWGNGGNSCNDIATGHLDLVEGYAVGRGSLTSAAGDDSGGGCANAGRDLVYRFTVPPGHARLTAQMQFSADASPAVYLTRGASCAGATSVACDTGNWLTSPVAEVVVNNPAPDTWYLWVEGASVNQLGPYVFNVWAD